MFDRQIMTSIVIAASPRKVWRVLMDFESYGDWNPFIRRIAGRGVVGSWLEIDIQPQGLAVRRFRPTVLACKAEQYFAWHGELAIPGLFSGTHQFELSPAGGGTRFVHSEDVSGVLVPLSGKVLTATEAGFKAMNNALEARCAVVGGY